MTELVGESINVKRFEGLTLPGVNTIAETKAQKGKPGLSVVVGDIFKIPQADLMVCGFAGKVKPENPQTILLNNVRKMFGAKVLQDADNVVRASFPDGVATSGYSFAVKSDRPVADYSGVIFVQQLSSESNLDIPTLSSIAVATKNCLGAAAKFAQGAGRKNITVVFPLLGNEFLETEDIASAHLASLQAMLTGVQDYTAIRYLYGDGSSIGHIEFVLYEGDVQYIENKGLGSLIGQGKKWYRERVTAMLKKN